MQSGGFKVWDSGFGDCWVARAGSTPFESIQILKQQIQSCKFEAVRTNEM